MKMHRYLNVYKMRFEFFITLVIADSEEVTHQPLFGQFHHYVLAFSCQPG